MVFGGSGTVEYLDAATLTTDYVRDASGSPLSVGHVLAYSCAAAARYNIFFTVIVS